MQASTMVQTLVQQQRGLIIESIDAFDSKSLQELAQALAKTQGIVVFTGVGKSAFVAQKVAMTFVSCGTRAIFLSPTDALHGDIGMVNSSDWVVAISRTGASDELLQLAPFVKSRGAHLAAFVGKADSRLAQLADIVVITPYQRELGAIQMVPTTSAELQLIYADILAVATAQIKGLSTEDFARNHPAGQIGKRLNLRVCDMMLTGSYVPLASENQTVGAMLVELSNKRSGCLLIVDAENHLKGIFTDGDLRRSLEKHGKNALDMPLKDVMTLTPRLVEADVLAHDAMRLMEADHKRPITVMPVVREGKIVGLVRLHDLLQAGL